ATSRPTCAARSTASETWSASSPSERCAAPSSAPREHEHEPAHDHCHRQRREAHPRSQLPHAARPLPPRGPRADRHAHRLRHDELRRLHRDPRRARGEQLHGLRRAGRRRRGRDRRGAGAGRHAPSVAGGLLGEARPAMRLLHARHADERMRLPEAPSRSDGGGNPPRHLGQPLPLHGVQQDRRRHPVRRRQAARGRQGGLTMPTQLEDRREHHPPNPAGASARVETTHEVRVTTPDKVCGMGHRMKRKEDPRFIQGKGRYIDDVKLPNMVYMDIVRSPYAHAKILKIDASEALATPGVLAVITGEDLKKAGNLHWMPTLMSDTQMVLPIEKVVYYAQEICVVIATDRYIAADAVEKVQVEYEPLDPVIDPHAALDDTVLVREDKEKKTNHIWHWEAGDREATEAIFRGAATVVEQKMHLPRIHVSSIETCGMVANYHKARGHMQIYMTSQAPHAHRTVFALVSGLPEHMIQIISPDIGGGFGGKVPVYPGYVCCAVASLVLGRPVKWIEDRSENLQADSFARDYHMEAKLAADADGKIIGLKVKTLSDCGAADAAANPAKFPAGLYSICTGSYDMKAAHVEVDGVYTTKPPGGVAYRCSFRVTEAVHMIERLADIMAHELGQDPADFRLKNFIRPDQFPYRSPTGWEYDSGNYRAALEKAMDMIGYHALRKEQAEKRARGELMGIGIASFTEVVGAGPSRDYDILGIKMFDSAEIRIHPTGKAMARFGTKSQGQGHETTYAQIVAEELGLPAADVQVEEGDTDTAPYGLGTYASRSTPTAGAAAAMAARKIKAK